MLSDGMCVYSQMAGKQHTEQGCLQSTSTCHTSELKKYQFRSAAHSSLFTLMSVSVLIVWVLLDRLVMGTRCGDLDPAVVLYIQNATGRGPKEMDKLFNKESGLLGMAGKSDVRAILDESAQGNERANLAMNVSHSPEHLATKLNVGASTSRSVDSKHSMLFPGTLRVSI